MIFYELELLSVPKILFVCSVEYDKYANHFSMPEDYLEISVCERGRILFDYGNGNTEIAYPGMLIPILSDIKCDTSAYNNEKQRHSTVGVEIKYRMKKYLSERECDIEALRQRMKEKCIILIPYHVDMADIYKEIINIVKKINVSFFSDIPGGWAKAISGWYKLTGLLTDFVFKRLNETKLNIPPSQLVYTSRAIKYIVNNYMNRLSVNEIAANMGISEGYLHRIFKLTRGVGVTEYINRYRVSVAVDLMRKKNLSLKEAAVNVGIEDPAYMSRLFKKIMGMSCREYFALEKNK